MSRTPQNDHQENQQQAASCSSVDHEKDWQGEGHLNTQHSCEAQALPGRPPMQQLLGHLTAEGLTRCACFRHIQRWQGQQLPRAQCQHRNDRETRRGGEPPPVDSWGLHGAQHSADTSWRPWAVGSLSYLLGHRLLSSFHPSGQILSRLWV